MAIKDYYKILNVKPDASATSIKQSYRKLAMKYHPDRNPQDDLSAAVFSEIAEAYSVLSNPSARKDYNYQRYHTAVSEYSRPAETIDTLLNKATRLKKQVDNINPFRFNSEALLYSIKQLLPHDIVSLLKASEIQQKEFLEIIVRCSNMLTSAQIRNLFQLMHPLFKKHKWLKWQLDTFIKQQAKKESWEKNKIILAVIITLLLCAIIFVATKK
ncbi:MAG TPA: DnaJ domain-containing protein [Parafilimonas sp.]|nr:DnaJ domain-containing protein [Parafilimonas sp.]